MKWLVSLLTPHVLKWIWLKLGKFVRWVYDRTQLKQRQDGREALASSIEEISHEIEMLLRAGKEVPPELRERLRAASRRLNSDLNAGRLPNNARN